VQITFRPLDILSRVVAVLLLAALAAWLVMAFAAWEVEQTSKLSHQELVAYIKEGYDPSFALNYLRMALLTLIYVALVEGVAFVIRCAVRAVQGEEPTRELRREAV
jgi:hypothetical protein